MKKIVLLHMIYAIVALMGSEITAAAFDLVYGGSNAVTVEINGMTFELGGTAKKVWADIGARPINIISWRESLVMDRAGNIKKGSAFNPDADHIVQQNFEFSFPKTVPVLHLGGFFSIADNGAYKYDLGLDGTGESGPRKVLENKKIW